MSCSDAGVATVCESQLASENELRIDDAEAMESSLLLFVLEYCDMVGDKDR
jgi:uncharacterized protein YjfI (DUF2170 family)